jgi:hypothetical protein
MDYEPHRRRIFGVSMLVLTSLQVLAQCGGVLVQLSPAHFTGTVYFLKYLCQSTTSYGLIISVIRIGDDHTDPH